MVKKNCIRRKIIQSISPCCIPVLDQKNKELAILKYSLRGSPSAWQREVLRMSHKEIKCACIARAVLSIYLSKHCSCCALSRREKLCCQIHNVINS